MADWERLRHRVRVAPDRIRFAWRDPAHHLEHAGLFDLEYYQAQFRHPAEAPRTLPDAVAHYVGHGRPTGLAFHPFVETEWWGGVEATEPSRAIEAESAFVRGWLTGVSTSPLLADAAPFGSARSLVEDIAAGRLTGRLPGGLAAADARDRIIGRIREGRRHPPNVGSHSNVDWAAARAAERTREPGRVSVLVPTYQDWRMTTESVRTALAVSGDADLEIVIVENGSRPAVFRMLTALFIAEPRVRIIACDVNTNFAGGMNRGIADSTGEYIVLLNNDALVTEGWLEPLLGVLRAEPEVRGVQPLLLYPHIRRIQAAGTMFLGEGVIPWHFLAGHPVEDAHRVRDLRFSAVTAAIMALRASDLLGVEGFDEGFANGYEDVDLCLRMITKPGQHFRVVPESEAVHPEGSSEGRSLHDTANRRRFFDLWRGRMPPSEAWRYEEIGLRLAALRPHWFVEEVPVMLSDPQLVRPERKVIDGPGAGLPCLRWVLALTSPVDEDRVAALASALERLGQEVVSIGGGVRFVDGLDDVLVAFTPAAPFTPRSATFNVLVVDGLGGLDGAAPVWEAVIVTDQVADREAAERLAVAAAAANGTSVTGVALGERAADPVLVTIVEAAARLRALNFSPVPPGK